MIRVWLLASGGVALLCALVVSAIIAQPRDDTDIRAFFMPDGCPMPCFLGIRPGVTTHEQALAILRAHPWVTALNDDGVSIRWMWNGAQPDFIKDLNGSFYAGRVNLRAGLVDWISLPTAVPFGDFLALFGAPSSAFSVNNYGPRSLSITQTLGYFDAGFEIEFTFPCPLRTRQQIWGQMVIVTYPNQSPALYDRAHYERWSC